MTKKDKAQLTLLIVALLITAPLWAIGVTALTLTYMIVWLLTGSAYGIGKFNIKKKEKGK